jgi:trehalose 6-phosphate phosphatase
MRHLFGAEGNRVLDAFARRRLLVGLDFDGTLAPIVSDPSAARMPAATRAALARAARLFPCVVISGRSREDVRRRLGRLPVAAVVGNHGLEPSSKKGAWARLVARWLPRLRRALEGITGVVIEDKGLSVAVHYRHARAKVRAREAALAAALSLGAVRIVPGKQVLNILPAGAPDKGSALRDARRRLRCEAAVYVGDDDTDEDAFAAEGEDTLLAVRVGRRRGSAARYYVDDPGEVAVLLARLACAREAPKETHS